MRPLFFRKINLITHENKNVYQFYYIQIKLMKGDIKIIKIIIKCVILKIIKNMFYNF